MALPVVDQGVARRVNAPEVPAGSLGAAQISELIARARLARAAAYCPYSSYAVGAAVLAEGGNLYVGGNVENASFGLSVCAERVALFSAAAAGARRIEALAVVTRDLAAPCGACRQVLVEFAPAHALVVLAGPEPAEGREVLRLEQLLPRAFGAGSLDRD